MNTKTTTHVRTDVRDRGVRVYVSVTGNPSGESVGTLERAAESAAVALLRRMVRKARTRRKP